MRVVGSAIADSRGRYAIELKSDTLRGLADPAGVVTFNVSVLHEGRFQSSPVQLRVEPKVAKSTGRSSNRAGASGDHLTGRADFKLADKRLTRSAVSQENSRPASAATSSSVSVIEDYGPRPVFVGQFISLVGDVTHRIDYSLGSQTSLGWAVSPTGDAGSFSVGGRQDHSADKSVWGKTTGIVVDRYRTQYVYQKRLYQTCTAGWVCDSEYRIEPVSYAGGFDVYTESDVPWPKKCVPQSANSGFTTSTSDGYTFDYGVAVSGMTTVELSAKSNFTQNVKQAVTFPTGGWMCGLDDYPGGDSPRVLSADTVNRGGSSAARSRDTISLDAAKQLQR